MCVTKIKQIKKYDFDIVGVQEPFYDQVNDMLNSLPDYHRFGSSDDDLVNSKTNHHHDVFYNTRKFTLLANGKFWLSPNAPVSPPDSLYSAAWGGKAKVCTWGKFKGNYSETVFYVFNAHFYYANKETRIESARLILDQIKKIAGGLPAIFMGDLNLNPDSEAYKILSCSGLLEDSYNWARINLPKDTLLHQTFNKWQTKVLLKESIENNRIDYIFITNQWKNKVKSHSVIWDSYSKDGIDKMPSDHNPVFVELENL